MTSVLVACLEESEEVPQDLLDVLLLPLLPSSKAENAAAYGLVGRVLQGAPANTQTGISQFLNQVLVGAPSGGKGKVTESELTDHIYPLIYEIHKLAPDLLLKVLPSVCTQLQAEEEEVRLKAVKLLGRLFASTYAEYGAEFSRNFKEFVGRFVDVSTIVRLEMVDSSALIIRRKPVLRDAVERPLRERLRDPDAEVRLGALQRMVELAQEDPLKLAVASFQEMGARVKDRRPEIRRAALMGMAQIYAKHLACALPPLSELTDAGEDLLVSQRGGLVERLQQVPALVLNCWSFPEPAMKQQVLTLLQEYLLPRSNKGDVSTSQSASQSANMQDAEMDSRRASALYFMFAQLNEAERSLLGSLLQHKASVRKELQAFLTARDAVYVSTKAAASTTSAEAVALKNCVLRLMLALPTADKKAVVLERLSAMKDKNIFRLLSRAAQPLDTAADALHGRDDLRGRVDSKSPLGEYVGRLCDAAGYLVANEDIIAALVRHATEMPPENSACIAALLAMLAKQVPRAFSASADPLEGWLATQVGLDKKHSASGGIVLSLIFATLQRSAEGIADDEGCQKLCSAVLKLALESSSEVVCGAAAEAASAIALFSEAKDFNDDITMRGAQGRLSDSGMNESSNAVLKTLRSLTMARQLDVNNPRLSCGLHAAAGLLQYPLLGAASVGVKQAFSARVAASASVRKALCKFIQDQVLRAGRASSVIAAGLHTWTAALLGEFEVDELQQKNSKRNGEHDDDISASGISSTSIISGGAPSLRRLAEFLWAFLDSEGASSEGLLVTAAVDRLQVFEAATSCALQLCRLAALGKYLTVHGWKRLAWSLLYPDDGFRQRLARQLFSMVQTSGVHLRFLVYPALFTTDEALGYGATQSLLFNVRRLRRTHEIMSRRAQADADDDMQRKAAVNMPENVLPYVLYLLSYHPDFPSDMSVESEDDRRKLRKIAALVRSVVRVLVESLGSEENNIAFLLKQVNMVQAHYEDRHDKENIGLYFVTRLATKILSEMVRTDDNVQEYRGDVSLPMELYHLRADAVRPGERGPTGDFFHSVVRDGMAEAEMAMDRALGAVRKTGPTRPGQTAAQSRKKSSSGGATSRRTTKAASAEQAGDTESDASDSESDAEPKKPVERKRVKPATVSAPTRDEGIRKQPRRQSMATVSYREADESEKETIQWNEMAARDSSPVRRVRGSASRSVPAEATDAEVSVSEEDEPSPHSPSPKKKKKALVPRNANATKSIEQEVSSKGKQKAITEFMRGTENVDSRKEKDAKLEQRASINTGIAAKKQKTVR